MRATTQQLDARRARCRRAICELRCFYHVAMLLFYFDACRYYGGTRLFRA